MKTLLRLVALIADRKRCPGCLHDKAIHSHAGCLGSVYDDFGRHVDWCSCEHTHGKGVAA